MDDDILDDIDKEELPKLFSKTSVIIASTLFSPVFGSFIYASNLGKLNLKKHIIGTIITAVIYTFLINKGLRSFGDYKLLIMFPLHVLGGVILAIPFWQYHIGETRYISKFAWLPISVMLLIAIGLIVLNLYGGI